MEASQVLRDATITHVLDVCYLRVV